MDISVVICTYKRPESLRQTLSSFEAIPPTPGLSFEIVVVDNNSKDQTPIVCAAFAQKLPLRCVQETRIGLACARNRGIAESQGSLIAFTDDDVNVHPAWLREMWDAARRHPETSFFGGTVTPVWARTPPPWVEAYSRTLLGGMVMCLDRGGQEQPLSIEQCLMGANMVFRASAIQANGLFREDLGMTGRTLRMHEETDYVMRLLQAGHSGLYIPKMIVFHRTGPERTTERYLACYFKGLGASDARTGEVRDANARLFGAPRYLWRLWAQTRLRWLCKRLAGGTAWVPLAVDSARLWGALQEFRQMRAKLSPGGQAP